MSIQDKIKNWIKETLNPPAGGEDDFVLVHPKDIKNGDYSFFSLSKNPEEDVQKLNGNKLKEIEKIEAVGKFINFYLSKDFFAEAISDINKKGEKCGKTNLLNDQKILVEHTQPNPFKPFHIGHLMNNAIGESIARILMKNGAEVKTASYHGDKGLHVAKWVWATQKGIDYGNAYANGNQAYENDKNAKQEITDLNKAIYEGKVATIWKICDEGLEKFKKDFRAICEKLDSRFDYQFWETAAGDKGKEIVVKHTENGIFEKSEEAIIFRGEKYGLHTRVFINSEELPTYEAKEIGLAWIKNSLEHFDESITITGNEQDSFFDVTEVAIGEVFPELKGKLKHLSHGMLRLSTGKMSSRTGDVITAGFLLERVKDEIKEKIKDREFDKDEKEKISKEVAIGAIKYSILRQAIGGDIIFDFDKSISFEGDSGPYLQYACVRAQSVLRISNFQFPISKQFSSSNFQIPKEWEITELERYLYRFPEVVERAGREYAPHYIVTYLTELASIFNGFYAKEKIIDENDPSSPYKIALTSATAHILHSGLHLLGIKVPERM